MSYVGLDPRHLDEVFGFPLQCRGVWATLLSGRHSLEIPGLMVTGPAALAEEMGNSVEEVHAALEGLEQRHRIQWNRQQRVIRIPKALEFYPAPGPNIVRGWFRKWESIPNCELKYIHVETVSGKVSLSADSAETMQKAWRETFARVDSNKIKHFGTLPLPFFSPSGNPSGNPSETKGSGSGSGSGSGIGSGKGIGSGETSGKGSERVPVDSEAQDSLQTRCERLWGLQEELRAKLGLPAKKAPGAALEAFRARIRDHADQQVEHVLQVCFAESEANPGDAKWFDGYSNWQEEAFDRKLGRSVASVRAQSDSRRSRTFHYKVTGDEQYGEGKLV